MSERFDPYKRLGSLWIPDKVEQEVLQEQAQQQAAAQQTRQQRRYQRRQELKKSGKWVAGVNL